MLNPRITNNNKNVIAAIKELNKERLTHTSFYFPVSLLTKFKLKCTQNNTPMTKVIRQLMTQYINEEDKDN